MTRIRIATKADLPRILRLIRQGVQENALLSRSKKELVQRIEKKWVIVATEKENLIGIGVLDYYSARLSELRTLFVTPAFRKTGIGQKIVQALVQKAKKRHIKELLTITLKEKKTWFQKQGFAEEAHGFKVALFKKIG